MSIILKQVALPDFGTSATQPVIPAATYEARANATYARAGTDWVVVYADREHIGNIAFLSGFEPRFEEAYLLLGPNNRRVVLAGNESESYAVIAGLSGIEVLRAQSLSLMGQDRSAEPRLFDRFKDAGIKAGDSVGLVGWKYLEPEEDEGFAEAFYLPAGHVNILRRLVGNDGSLRDVTSVLMHPETGLRSSIDADQIAAYEWSATRASLAVWNIVSNVRPGDSEFLAASRMNYQGDPLNCHTMFSAAGPDEFIVGLRSPSSRIVSRGEGATTAIGMWGALASRAGLVDESNDAFLEKAKAYFAGLVAWYDAADIGVAGAEVHDAVVETLARGGLRSSLNCGHLTSHDEWMHSPIRPGSTEKLRSGMPFQVDIIPTPMQKGWALNCEDPATLADETLRSELKARHPETWGRIEARRAFMRDQLGVDLKASILPLSSTPLYLPPFWLKADHVLVQG